MKLSRLSLSSFLSKKPPQHIQDALWRSFFKSDYRLFKNYAFSLLKYRFKQTIPCASKTDITNIKNIFT